MKGLIVILIALFIEAIALYGVNWNPIKLLKFAATTKQKTGPIVTFIMWTLITILVVFFIVQGIMLL